jgi:hypothetical protein
MQKAAVSSSCHQLVCLRCRLWLPVFDIACTSLSAQRHRVIDERHIFYFRIDTFSFNSNAWTQDRLLENWHFPVYVSMDPRRFNTLFNVQLLVAVSQFTEASNRMANSQGIANRKLFAPIDKWQQFDCPLPFNWQRQLLRYWPPCSAPTSTMADM